MNETLGEVGEKCYRIHLIHYTLLLLPFFSLTFWPHPSAYRVPPPETEPATIYEPVTEEAAAPGLRPGGD